MDCLILDENKKIIHFIPIENIKEIQNELGNDFIQENWEIIENYKKTWPISEATGDKLSKNLCYWNSLEMEVKAKTQTMIDNELIEKINCDLKDICNILLPVINDCNTFDDFKNKIVSTAGG